MAAPKIVEHAPGAMPDIRTEGDSVIFYMDLVGTRPPARLVLRCDAEGNVWASVAIPSSRPAGGITPR